MKRVFRCVFPQAYPIPCDPGQYAVTGSMNCTDCPAGSECPSTQLKPTRLCEPGLCFCFVFEKLCFVVLLSLNLIPGLNLVSFVFGN